MPNNQQANQFPRYSNPNQFYPQGNLNPENKGGYQGGYNNRKGRRQREILVRKREHPFITKKRLVNYILHKKKIYKDNKLRREYGCMYNPHVSVFTSAIKHYSKIPIYDYMDKIENSKINNLCRDDTCLPSGIDNILGKGLKFCVQPLKLSKEQRTEEKERFKRDVRLKYFVLDDTMELDNREFNTKLYIRSEWQPPIAEPDLEYTTNNMFDKLNKERKKRKDYVAKSTNLTLTEQETMRWIKQSKETTIAITDKKNLGICINDTKTFITAMLEEYLLREDTYKRLSEEEAIDFTEGLYEDIEKLLCDKFARRLEGTYEGNYLMTGINKYKKSPYVYGMAKVHKKYQIQKRLLIGQ